MPVSGRNFLKYGGNTTCFSLETERGFVIFDAGTGITSLNGDLLSRSKMPPITIVFTHFHLDHVVGLPCFMPLYSDKTPVTLMAAPPMHQDWRSALVSLIASPYWPADLTAMLPADRFRDLEPDGATLDICGAKISWCPVFHPQGCLSYKIEGPENTIVIATDHEHGQSDISAGFLEFCRGADFLIYDAMYTPAEYTQRAGWGHGNWQQGVQLAMEAQIRELIFTHHDITRTDQEIDEMVRLSRRFFPRTRAAMENMVLSV